MDVYIFIYTIYIYTVLVYIHNQHHIMIIMTIFHEFSTSARRADVVKAGDHLRPSAGPAPNGYPKSWMAKPWENLWENHRKTMGKWRFAI